MMAQVEEVASNREDFRIGGEWDPYFVMLLLSIM